MKHVCFMFMKFPAHIVGLVMEFPKVYSLFPPVLVMHSPYNYYTSICDVPFFNFFLNWSYGMSLRTVQIVKRSEVNKVYDFQALSKI